MVLDVLLDRRPHAEASTTLWRDLERGRARGLLAGHGVTTLFYLMRKARGPAFARRATSDLLSVFDVVAVDGDVLRRAILLEWPDFEDAVCAACALAAGASALVTRDPPGFRDPPLPVLDPRSAVALLAAEDETV